MDCPRLNHINNNGPPIPEQLMFGQETSVMSNNFMIMAVPSVKSCTRRTPWKVSIPVLEK